MSPQISSSSSSPWWLLVVLVAVVGTFQNVVEAQRQQYGVDCSFPIHHREFSCPEGVDLGDKEAVYEHFMKGCFEYFGAEKGEKECVHAEFQRLNMSLWQPRAMRNYTDTGYRKILAPPEVMELLYQFWEQHKDKKVTETPAPVYIYCNQWESPTYLVNIMNESLEGGGYYLKKQFWDAAQKTMEEWTQMEVTPSFVYGIRVYSEGAILTPHVDRLPLVFSAIVNVAQDVDEDWPLEVIDRFGNAVNVTMKPGDMVLYESGSLIHSRPFPLKGRFYANIFIHFETTGRPLSDTTGAYMENLDGFYPPYLQSGTPWADWWASKFPYGWVPADLHEAAANGDINRLRQIAQHNRNVLIKGRDKYGWTALHEAARAANVEIAKFLVEEQGADLNARTHHGTGITPLALALDHHGRRSAIATYFKERGALDLSYNDEL